MSAETQDRPWEELLRLLDSPGVESIQGFLEALPPGDAARALARLDEADRSRLLAMLDPVAAADLVERIPDAQAVEIIEDLAPGTAAAILHELPSDQQADVLGDLAARDAEAILDEMAPEEAREARELSRYDDDVAGGLMVKEFVAYREDDSLAQVVDDFRANADRYRDYYVQYAYVTDPAARLVGVLRLRDLLFAPPERLVRDLMIREPLTVRDSATLDELRAVFDAQSFYGLPVVDAHGRLLGIVRRARVEEALGGRSESDYLKSQGIVGGEELRSMPLLVRSRRRLSWLSINIVLNVIAASVIALYQDTLASVIALAVFLPIISDMSGCSGNQAVAVSMRELALGFVKPTELGHVWLKEVAVGVINGAALGGLIAAVAWLWKGNPWLGIVVGVAMALNTVVAVSLGGTIPLILRRMGTDPALASGPVLTTVTDMCGFLLILGIASAMLPLLTG